MSNNLLNSLLDANSNSASNSASNSDSREYNTLLIKSKIVELSNLLMQSHPRMPMLLRDIHTHIAKDPELAILLSEQEIGIIVSGLSEQTKTELISATVKSASSAAGKKKMSQLTLDDI